MISQVINYVHKSNYILFADNPHFAIHNSFRTLLYWSSVEINDIPSSSIEFQAMSSTVSNAMSAMTINTIHCKIVHE